MIYVICFSKIANSTQILDYMAKKYIVALEVEARAKVVESKKRGCTCPILYPVGDKFKL